MIVEFKKMWEDKKFQRIFWLGFAGMIMGWWITKIYYPMQPYRLGIITTDSIFKHITWWKKINPENTIIKKDNLYVFYFPKDTPYFKKGELFYKYAKCVAGDKLEVRGLKYYCNGKYIDTARTHDSKGKKVSHFIFNGIIPQGKVFMWAPHPHSYDSRYWGLLDTKKIIGVGIWAI